MAVVRARVRFCYALRGIHAGVAFCAWNVRGGTEEKDFGRRTCVAVGDRRTGDAPLRRGLATLFFCRDIQEKIPDSLLLF